MRCTASAAIVAVLLPTITLGAPAAYFRPWEAVSRIGPKIGVTPVTRSTDTEIQQHSSEQLVARSPAKEFNTVSVKSLGSGNIGRGFKCGDIGAGSCKGGGISGGTSGRGLRTKTATGGGKGSLGGTRGRSRSLEASPVVLDRASRLNEIKRRLVIPGRAFNPEDDASAAQTDNTAGRTGQLFKGGFKPGVPPPSEFARVDKRNAAQVLYGGQVPAEGQDATAKKTTNVQALGSAADNTVSKSSAPAEPLGVTPNHQKTGTPGTETVLRFRERFRPTHKVQLMENN